MKQYYISKKNYNGEVVFVNCDKINGYKFSPKNSYPYEGIKVNEMIIIKPSLIEKIIKRKIKNRLEFYLKIIIDNLDDESDDDTRIALDDLARYKKVIKERYSIYLDEKYMALLNKKINVIERELKNNLLKEKEEVYESTRRR